jgi:hypothetical protein
VAKKFENGRGTPGQENSMTKQVLPAERILSVLRESFCPGETEKWPQATYRATVSAKMPDRWTDGVVAGRKAVFILWAEPMVSFRKEISILSESNRVTKASVNLGKALAFPGSLPG